VCCTFNDYSDEKEEREGIKLYPKPNQLTTMLCCGKRQVIVRAVYTIQDTLSQWRSGKEGIVEFKSS